MDVKELPARPSLERFNKLARDILKAHKSGDATAIRRIKDHYQVERPPTWDELRAYVRRLLPKLSNSATAKFVLADARFLVAGSYGFESWAKFVQHIEAFTHKSSLVSKFESAADAIITGDVAALERLLRENPELIRSRSTRAHQSTLLHYVSANGVEDYRQKTPKNAVEVAKILLQAGAAVDAENNPARGTTLGLVATSIHPLQAGVQIALLETLLEAGAAIDGAAGGWNPLIAALANGRQEAAEFLARRGARLDLEGAAGVGRLDLVKGFFNKDGSLKANATKAQMMSGYTWACEYGRTNVVDFLLRRGIEVGARLKHHGQTGLHWAAIGGHSDTVRLLLKRKAPVDIKDERLGGTPLGWAIYGWGVPPPGSKRSRYYEVVALLVSAGATVDPEWIAGENVRADPRMLAALTESRPATTSRK